jgi:GPI ethanolamine phosphate transferase 3 subunit O
MDVKRHATVIEIMEYSFQSRRRKHNAAKLADLIVPLLAIGGLYWFSASFFLAKRSLSHVSICDEANELLIGVLGLTKEETLRVLGTTGSTYDDNSPRDGCWLNRQIDSMVILVVDALRFDFARDRLPLSVGRRIKQQHEHNENGQHFANNRTTSSSQLLQFVADPPTVTMQRLKGLTTGSLPTFADISGNMVCLCVTLYCFGFSFRLCT